MASMSDTANHERNLKNGQFIKGYKGGPGRKPGSRNALSESFLSDLSSAWEKHGAAALDMCAITDPSAFIKVVASLLPRDVNLDIDIRIRQAHSALDAFRLLQQIPESDLKQIESQVSDADDN
jgi:hypothetical protein